MSQPKQLTIEQALSRAKKAIKQGNPTVAVEIYTAILQQQPNHPIAKKSLRKLQKDLPQNPSLEADTANPAQDQITTLVNLFHAEQIVELEEASRELLKKYPQSSIVMNILGMALGAKGQLKESIQVFDKAIQLKPDYADTYSNRGIALQRLGELDEAMQDFDQAIQLKPDYAEAYSNRGNALKDLRQLDIALESYDKAIQLKPDLTQAYNNRGNTLKELGLLDEALKSYDKAIQLKPDFAEPYFNRGVILEQLGQLGEALKSYDKAIQLKPGYASAYCNRGNALKALGQLDEALKSYGKAIQLKPDYAKPYNNRGYILNLLGQLDEALKSFDKTIQLKPDYAEAYSNRGVVLKDLGRLDEALTSFDKAIQLKPDYAKAYSNFLLTLNYTPDLNVSDHIATARKFGELVTDNAKPRFTDYQCQPTPEKLRVGLVSGDLVYHPIGYFLESVLSSIDLSRIELIAYLTAPAVDDLSDRIKPFFSMWKPIYSQTDEAAANMIYADGVHVLLDLSGHTAGNRLLMFGHKPSPVQASWLGYFATTGLNEMDYLIGDPFVTPPKDDDQFTENVWRLPETRWCFTPPNVDIDVSVPPALNHGYVTFGCFNNATKVNDRVVALWAKVLEAIPNSCLLLKAPQFRDQMVRESIIQRFAAQGINSKRINLEGPEDRQKYFAAYNKIDITLDPFPFTGGTTSVESLWMGVPLVTLAGGSLISRQGVGVLMNAGLSDWVAADEEEYVAKAVLFASDLDKLASLRAGLRSQVLASPLFDAPRFARNIEKALWDMWNQWDPPSTPKEMRKLQKESTQNKSVEAKMSDSTQDQKRRTQKIHPIPSAQASAQEQIDALISLYNQGQFEEIVTQTTALLKQFPQAIILHNIQGAANAGLQLFDAAIENYQLALLINPDYVEALNNLGVALKNKGDLAAAIKTFNRALQIKPDHAEVHNNLGTALKQEGHLIAAIESYNRAIETNRDHAEAHNNLSNALLENGDTIGAIESCNRSIEIKPNYAEAHNSLGNALQQNGDPIAAIKSFNHALAIQPDFALARSYKLRQQTFICDWREIESDRNLIPDLGVSTGMVTPFTMLYLEDDSANHLKRSELFAQTKCIGKDKVLAPIARPSERPKLLKIGYFSGDFHSHPVMSLIVKMLALHNRSNFEIHAFSFGPTIHDNMREKLVNNVDAFHDVHGIADQEIAKLARNKSIDIAIDLGGYTQNGRWGILACRPAPIQVSYLGYPGSMGAGFIDYIIADSTLIPKENRQFYSEKIVYMPHCYQVSDNSRMPSQVNVKRSALGLPEAGFVFCCLNTNYKITPREFDIWMRLLNKVEGSVLWLARSNQWSEANLRKEAQARGLDTKRLVFSGGCEYSEYLARLTKADLFLDTFNFNAGAIANDALWSGLPIVTKQGQSYTARMASSLLNAVGLPELITTNERDYEKIALDIATSPKKLKSIKAKLTISKKNTPLFDTERFTRNIETAYMQMYTKYFTDEKLEHLFIKEHKIH